MSSRSIRGRSRSRKKLGGKIVDHDEGPSSVFDAKPVRKVSRSPNKRKLKIFDDSEKNEVQTGPRRLTNKSNRHPQYSMKDSAHPRMVPKMTKTPGFLGDNSINKPSENNLKEKQFQNAKAFHTGNANDIISKVESRNNANTRRLNPTNNINKKLFDIRGNKMSFQSSKNNTLFDEEENDKKIKKNPITQRLSNRSENNLNFARDMLNVNVNQKKQRTSFNSTSKGNISRDKIKENSRMMSKDKRLSRYSRRNDKRSRSPGGGIKLKFGDTHTSRRNSAMSGQGLGVPASNPLQKRVPSKPIRSTSRNKMPPRTSQKNIFGQFIKEDKPTTPNFTALSPNNIISKKKNAFTYDKEKEEEDEKSALHSFDTDPESSMINSTSEIHSNLDVSANLSRISNVTGRSLSRHRPSKPKLFDDDEDHVPNIGPIRSKRTRMKSVGRTGKSTESPLAAHLSKARTAELESQVKRLRQELEQSKKIQEFYKQESVKQKGEIEGLRERLYSKESSEGIMGSEVQRLTRLLEQRDAELSDLRNKRTALENDKNNLLISLDKDAREVIKEKEQNDSLKKKLKELENQQKMNTFKFNEKTKIHETEMKRKEKEIDLYKQRELELKAEIDILKGDSKSSMKKDNRYEMHIESLKQSLKQREEILLMKEKRIKNLELEQIRGTRRIEQEELARMKAEEKVLEYENKLQREQEKIKDLDKKSTKYKYQESEQINKLQKKIRELEEELNKKNEITVTAKKSDELEFANYENEKLKKNNRILELKVAEMKSLRSKAEKESLQRMKEINEIKFKSKKSEEIKTELEVLKKDFFKVNRTREIIEKDLSRAMLKIGNALQVVNSVKLSNKERDKLMNALVGV